MRDHDRGGRDARAGRNWYADLLVGAGGIIAGSALHGPLGAFITIMGVICILERAADAGFAVTG